MTKQNSGSAYIAEEERSGHVSGMSYDALDAAVPDEEAVVSEGSVVVSDGSVVVASVASVVVSGGSVTGGSVTGGSVVTGLLKVILTVMPTGTSTLAGVLCSSTRPGS